MPDPIDIQRQKEQDAADMVDQAMDKLEESRELNREHQARLRELDAEHFFDPAGRQVLRLVNGRFRTIASHLDESRHSVAGAEAELTDAGFKAIGNGLYWNRLERSLYVNNGGHYVLYARDPRRSVIAGKSL